MDKGQWVHWEIEGVKEPGTELEETEDGKEVIWESPLSPQLPSLRNAQSWAPREM